MEKLQAKLLERYVALKNVSQDGQGMVEYALILFLVSVVAIAFLTAIGTDVKDVFNSVEDALLGNDQTP
jgi:pilus assembly protein Flp/PilA